MKFFLLATIVAGVSSLFIEGKPAQAGIFNTYVYSPPPNLQSVPPATCGAGSLPEDGLQGEVPLADRQSGRSSTQPYSCNMTMVSQYQGLGASWVNPFYSTCGYMASAFPSNVLGSAAGTTVLDLSNPAQPTRTALLTSSAMAAGPWESLKVNTTRGLLAAVSGGPGVGVAFFDVYSVSPDCAHPTLLNGFAGTTTTFPSNVIGHEGNWAPDGKTYWASGLAGGIVTAIDVSDASKPHIVYTGTTGATNHGFSLSTDGTRLYMTTVAPAGVQIFNVASIQNRALIPLMTFISSISWTDGLITQHTIPVSYSGHQYLIAVDEAGSGGARFIDISNETHPAVVSQIKLAINLNSNTNANQADIQGNGLFGYDSHYCNVDNQINPTAMACGWFQSGIRVFDIRQPLAPKEIAYYNPIGQAAQRSILLNSDHASGFAGHSPPVLDVNQLNLPTLSAETSSFAAGTNPTLTADWCSSPPTFSGKQLWVTCQDNGMMVLQFTNNVYPFQ